MRFRLIVDERENTTILTPRHLAEAPDSIFIEGTAIGMVGTAGLKEP